MSFLRLDTDFKTIFSCVPQTGKERREQAVFSWLPPTQARMDLKAQLSIPLSIIFCSSLFWGIGRPPITAGFKSFTGLLLPIRWSRTILYWMVELSILESEETESKTEAVAFAAPPEAAMFLNDTGLSKCSLNLGDCRFVTSLCERKFLKYCHRIILLNILSL